MTVCDDEESAAEAVRQALLTLCSSPNDQWNASAPTWVLKAAGRKACLVSFPEPIVVRLPVVSGSESSLLRGRAAHCRALAAERIAAAAEALRYAVEGQLEAQACEDRAEMIEKGREMVSLYREQGIDLANQSQIRSLRSKQLELQTKCNAQDLTIGNYEAALRESLQALPMKQLRAMVSERLAKAPGARLGRKALIDQLVEDLTMQDKEDRGDSLEPSN